MSGRCLKDVIQVMKYSKGQKCVEGVWKESSRCRVSVRYSRGI